MQLYYVPGACSLASHIAGREAGVPLVLDRVDVATRRTESGQDFTTVNPKGAVPALRLDSGEVLTESAAILQYLADRAPDSGLAPAFGTLDRYRLQEWLSYVSTELHPQFGPLWNPQISAEQRHVQKENINRKLAFLDRALSGRDHLVGRAFTAADAYAFAVVGWCRIHALSLQPFTNLEAFMARTFTRPAVQAAMRAEGLLEMAA